MREYFKHVSVTFDIIQKWYQVQMGHNDSSLEIVTRFVTSRGCDWRISTRRAIQYTGRVDEHCPRLGYDETNFIVHRRDRGEDRSPDQS